MALYNEILSARFNRFLQKLFSMKGPAPSPQVAAEISSAIPLFSGVENRFLEGWDRFGTANNQGAVAAQASAVQLRNPGGSNVAAVIEKLIILSTTSGIQGNISQQGTSNDLGTVVAMPAQRLDSRGRQGPALILSRANNAADLSQLVLTYGTSAANDEIDMIYTENQELTLMPGDAIRVNTNTVNVNLVVAWLWRERPLESSEIT